MSIIIPRGTRLARWNRITLNSSRTTLCFLFWNTVLFVPGFLICLAILSPVWVPIMLWQKYCHDRFEKWRDMRRELKYWRQIEKYRRRLEAQEKPPSLLYLLWEWLKVMKNKVCPLVEMR